MQIDPRKLYLVIDDSKDARRSVRIVTRISTAVSEWTPGTRLSPIWRVGAGTHDYRDFNFDGKHELILLGPIPAIELFKDIPDAQKYATWISVGCLNVVVHFPAGLGDTEKKIQTVSDWARNKDLAFERWLVSDGQIEVAEVRTRCPGVAKGTLQSLSELYREDEQPALRPILQEYVTAMASAVTRAAAVYPSICDELMQVADATKKITSAHRNGQLTTLDTQSRLLSLNAALSRFSSQSFSGIPPVLQTECHFWIQSLLGTGVANIALARLAAWIQGVLGEARIRERLETLSARTDGVPDLDQLTTSNALLDEDILEQVVTGPVQPVIPLITYFSGRDGFSSHLQTLSAPLTTIAECNSYRSSLLTITHEISHIFVQSALAELYPEFEGAGSRIDTSILIQSGFKASNWLDAARQLLAEGLISMEQCDRGGGNIAPSELQTIAAKWRREAQEILVHSFDFLYFYSGDPKFYVESIWHSWCAIPGIEERVPEYLMRTLCAVSSSLLKQRHPQRFDAARKEVRNVLERLNSSGDLLSDYAGQAIRLLNEIDQDDEKKKQFSQEYSARLYLTRLVAIFLHSKTLESKLFTDPLTRPGKSNFRSLELVAESIGNPLTFLRTHLHNNPSEAESVWILHNLAFNSVDDGLDPRSAP